jgi:hypothetical protein
MKEVVTAYFKLLFWHNIMSMFRIYTSQKDALIQKNMMGWQHY